MGIYSFVLEDLSDRVKNFKTGRIDPKDVHKDDIYFMRYPGKEYKEGMSLKKHTMYHYGLVVGEPKGDIAPVMYMTSYKDDENHEYPEDEFFKMEKWKESGLPKKTMIGFTRIHKVGIKNNFSERVGELQKEDKDTLKDRISKHKLDYESDDVYLAKRYLKEEYIEEEKLKAAERTDFGLPAKKKYPMPDEGHVKQAIRMFNHCDPEDEAELARNIKKYMKKYNMEDVQVSENNRFSKYYHPKKNVKEEAITEDTKFSMMKDIYDQLTPEEQSFLGNKFIDSPYSVFRKVAMDKGKPVAFCEIYDGIKMLNRKEYIMEMAVVPDYRRKGLAKSLIKEMEKFCNKSDKHKRMVYLIKKENKPSEALAIKSKYKKEKIHNTSYLKSDHHVYYKWIGKTPKYEDPWDLNNWMCDNFKYGLLVNGKYKGDWIDGKDFSEHYKSPTISSMYENNIGVCWDTVNFIADYFENCYPDSWKCYYIESEDSDTHTWFAFKDDYNRQCVCEVSWEVNQGIHIFKSEKQMIDFYTQLEYEHWGGNKGYVLYEYRAGKEYTGLNCVQFMSKIYKEGTFLGDTKGVYKKIIKPRITHKDEWWDDKVVKEISMVRPLTLEDYEFTDHIEFMEQVDDIMVDIDEIRDPLTMEEYDVFEHRMEREVGIAEARIQMSTDPFRPEKEIEARKIHKAVTERFERVKEKFKPILEQVIRFGPVLEGERVAYYPDGTKKLMGVHESLALMNEGIDPKEIEIDKASGQKKLKGDSIYTGYKSGLKEKDCLKQIKYEKLKNLGDVYGEAYKKPQPGVHMNGGVYRARAEMLIFNEKGQVLIDRGKIRSFPYTLPGGGVDKGDSIVSAAKREAEEEALVVTKNVRFTGIIWTADYTNPAFNKGSISFLCVGEYDKPYKGYVKKEDRCDFAKRAEWIDLDKIKLGEPHALAAQMYLDGEPFTEMSGGSGIVGMEINDQSVQDISPAVYFFKYGERVPKTGDDDQQGLGIGIDMLPDKMARVKLYEDGSCKVVSENFEEFMQGRNYVMYKYVGDMSRYRQFLEDYAHDNLHPDNDLTFFYEYFTNGKHMMMPDQLDFDYEFFEVVNLWRDDLERSMKPTSVLEVGKMYLEGGLTYFPSMTDEDLELESMVKRIKPTYKLMNDQNGYFIYDESTLLRSKSVDKEFIEMACKNPPHRK